VINLRSKIIGYTAGVFDLFHIGHLNMLRNAKSMCDELIVGVSSDALVEYKFKSPVIPFNERIEIVRCIKYVDLAVPQNEIDKFIAWEKLKYNILFVGDDWYGENKWKDYEKKLKVKNVKIIYFPYTKGISSTLLNQTLKKLRH
tara:strand:+ start:193 stop:624 length:432 start_codon:yes stop_codon:yes gene_type:complete